MQIQKEKKRKKDKRKRKKRVGYLVGTAELINKKTNVYNYVPLPYLIHCLLIVNLIVNYKLV